MSTAAGAAVDSDQGASGGWVVPMLIIIAVVGAVVVAAVIFRERQHRRRREELQKRLTALEGILVGCAWCRILGTGHDDIEVSEFFPFCGRQC